MLLLPSPNSNLHGQVFELEFPLGYNFLDYSTTTSQKLEEKLLKDIRIKPERSVSFFIPNSIISKKDSPLLIAFHGSNENGPTFRSRTTAYGYDELACLEGFVVAYPSGYKGNWNDSRRAVNYLAKTQNVDDIGFTRGIIEFSHKHWATSTSKTLIAGYSNGGHMCYRLALELGSSFIAGVAIHCANLPTWDNSDCNPLEADALPICILNGTADPVNPWMGGVVGLGHGGGPLNGRGSHQSSIETIDYFAKRYLERGIELEMEEFEDEDEIADVRQFRSMVDGRLRVQLVAMLGEGHYVPVSAGEKKALVIGPRRGAIHAPRWAIEFFKEATHDVFRDHHHHHQYHTTTRHRTVSDFSDASL